METVKIEDKNFADGFVIINKADFDESIMKIWGEDSADIKSAEKLSYNQLSKLSKAKLVAEAEKAGVKVTPDSMTNQQIIDAILGK